jgi:diguanylate cyclase (GGDEF)-like protein
VLALGELTGERLDRDRSKRHSRAAGQGWARILQRPKAIMSDPPEGLTRAVEPARVLVVEDDDSSRRGLELILQLSGYGVVGVPEAEAAIERVKRDKFDIAVVDVNLPGADGYELTERLRREPRFAEAPIILVSAQASSTRRVAGLDRGADDFVEKPVVVDELLARIRRHLLHARRENELLRRCTHDHLTGALSRAAIEDELGRELKRAERSHLPVSVMLVDLDGFKAINDIHGHDVGDDALRKTARRLARLVRSTDRVGRFGGDEFLIVLPDTDEDEARVLLERLRQDWRKHPPLPRGVPQPVQVSIGCVTGQPGESVIALVRRADRAMYADKGKRKSRISSVDSR